MNSPPLTIWCNAHFPERAMRLLREGLGPHRLLLPEVRNTLNLAAGAPDPTMEEADVAFGQPDPRQIVQLPRLRWVHLTTAGYTRYDTPEVRAALQQRGAILTNSSSVYSDPCAEHVLAMMLALARQLPQCWADQANHRSWRAAEHRSHCQLLDGQSALILGLGAITRRLIELLQPFRMSIVAVRRNVTGNEPVPTFSYRQVRQLLPKADHVINILPANPSTEQLVNADLIGLMKSSAIFYNIGRGTTVDQLALRTALETSKIAAAYLDVMMIEPLPPDDPLWVTPNCWITPHTAGGQREEFERLVGHFLENLRRFVSGQTMHDRIV